MEQRLTEPENVARGLADAVDRTTLGQRRINVLWEATQGVIAVAMVATVCGSVLMGRDLPAQFWVLAAIVVNAYFQRTNHTKIGGVGANEAGR